MVNQNPENTHLNRREIQAPLVGALIDGFAERFGAEEAHAVAREVIDRDAAEAGRALAEAYGGNSLAVLRRIIEELWAADDTMTLENVAQDKDCLRFDVTRCGYADMYERLGLKELGCLLSCRRDFAFMDGFNPNLTRSAWQPDSLS